MPDPVAIEPGLPVTPPPTRGRASGLVLVVIASLAGAAGGYVGGQWATRPLAAELATRPPVIIIDIARAMRGVPSDQMGVAIARQRDLARQLADGGVLVLDAAAVIEAPAALVLHPRGTP